MAEYNLVVENEKRILSCALEQPSLLYDIDPEWFACHTSKAIFDSIRNLYEHKVAITAENICADINDGSLLRLIKDDISGCGADIKDFSFYLGQLRLDYAKHDINSRVLDDLKVLTTSKGKLDLDKVEELHKILSKDIDLVRNGEASLQTITQVGSRYKRQLMARKNGEFYSYGDAELDKVTAGAMPGQMTTIVGTSGMGKSAYAINLFNKQINKRIPTMYVTLEMDEISTMDRLMALRCKLPLEDLLMKDQENTDCEDVLRKYDEELEKLKKMEDRFFIVDRPSTKLADLESMIEKAKHRMGVPYMIVIVDLWTMISDVGTTPQDIEKAVNATSEIAKRQGIHMINIVQANRQADSKSVPSPDLIDMLELRSINHIKNSGAIAERARTVLGVFRPKHYAETLFPDDPVTLTMDDIFRVTVLKCSQGQVGRSVKYLYRPEMFRVDFYRDETEDGYDSI